MWWTCILSPRQIYPMTAVFSDTGLTGYHSLFSPSFCLLQQLWIIFLVSSVSKQCDEWSFVVASCQILIKKFGLALKSVIKILLTVMGYGYSEGLCSVLVSLSLFRTGGNLLFFFFFLIMSLPCLSTFVFPNYRAIGIESSCVFREGRRHVVSMFSFSPGYAPCVLTLFKVLFARFSGPWDLLSFSRLSSWKRGNTQ